MSTARTGENEKMGVVAELGTDRSQRYGSVRPLGKYRGQVPRSPGQVRLSVVKQCENEWVGEGRTFMMGQDTARDLQLCAWCLGWQVGRGRLEEEEGFFRDGVVEFLCVFDEVSCDADDLLWCECVCEWVSEGCLPFCRG